MSFTDFCSNTTINAQQAAVEAVADAKHVGKPLAIEELDFAKKKRQLGTLKGTKPG